MTFILYLWLWWYCMKDQDWLVGLAKNIQSCFFSHASVLTSRNNGSSTQNSLRFELPNSIFKCKKITFMGWNSIGTRVCTNNMSKQIGTSGSYEPKCIVTINPSTTGIYPIISASQLLFYKQSSQPRQLSRQRHAVALFGWTHKTCLLGYKYSAFDGWKGLHHK